MSGCAAEHARLEGPVIENRLAFLLAEVITNESITTETITTEPITTEPITAESITGYGETSSSLVARPREFLDVPFPPGVSAPAADRSSEADGAAGMVVVAQMSRAMIRY